MVITSYFYLHRNPPTINPAAKVHESIATFTQVGIGMVRTRGVLPDEVHDTPTSVSLLNVPKRERGHFGPPQPAAQQDG